MEDFTDYRFKPVSLIKGPATKSSSYARIPILIGYAMTIAGFILLILLIVYAVERDQYDKKINWTDGWDEYHYTYEYRHWAHMDTLCVIMTSTGVPIFSVGVVILVLFYVLRRKHSPIQSIADYISTNKMVGKRKNLIIFVKNRKFGVMKKGLNKIVIPAQFDMLSWETKVFLWQKTMKCIF